MADFIDDDVDVSYEGVIFPKGSRRVLDDDDDDDGDVETASDKEFIDDDQLSVDDEALGWYLRTLRDPLVGGGGGHGDYGPDGDVVTSTDGQGEPVASSSVGPIPAVTRPPVLNIDEKGSGTYKNWCFTLNNYTPEEEKLLRLLVTTNQVTYLIYGREVGESGTPHLQGYVQMPRRVRLRSMKAIVSGRAHFEVAKGTLDQNITYCSKEGDVHVFGDPVKIGRPEVGAKRVGKLKATVDSIMAGMPLKDVLENHGSSYISNCSKIDRVVQKVKMEMGYEKVANRLRGEAMQLRPWQLSVKEIIDRQLRPRDGRTVNWFFEKKGNVGKTWLCTYLITVYGKDHVLVLDNGKTPDLVYVFNGQKVVLFDFTRCCNGYENYDAIEKIKNGRVLSTKYEPVQKVFNSPVVCIFSNVPPKAEKLSMDRWNIYEIAEMRLKKRNPLEFRSDILDPYVEGHYDQENQNPVVS